MKQEDFSILKENIYLDNSATTQKPRQVIEAIEQYYEKENANVHRGVYKLAEKATLAYEDAHQVVAKFINAKFEEIIFTKGTTESLNILASCLGKDLKEGDQIVITEMEHHSNLVPWLQLKQKGIILKFIPITDNFELDMENVKELINKRTKIVSVTHMSNVLGTINPIKKLAELAHKAGAVMIIDAAQSVPHFKIDVKELDCDFLAFSGHKMCGPTGIGVLYGKKELLQKMDPYQFGGDMIKEVSFEEATWNELPWKFEAGTPNIAGAVGLRAAIKYLDLIGMDKIAEHEKQLTDYALDKLSELPGLKVIGPKNNRGGVISFVVEGIHPHDLSEILDRDNICVRGGHHCAMPLHSKLGLTGSTRVSFYFYNTKEEINNVIVGIKKAIEVFK
jgi:cysteine desulfurase / selenocysteine lyase